MSIVLTSCRSVLMTSRMASNALLAADLTGLVTRCDRRGGIVFVTLNDGTGSVQLVYDESAIAETDWVAISKLSSGQRISVSGPVGQTKRGTVSIFPSIAPVVVPLHLELSSNDLKPALVHIGHQILLSRLRHRASAWFAAQQFLELEPRVISTTWDTSEVQPLRVDYPGFGCPVFLAPSPSSQIFRAILTCGYSRVFAISRCFTSTYRDDLVATESSILCGRGLHFDIDGLQELVTSGCRSILNEPGVMPEKPELLAGPWAVIAKDLDAIGEVILSDVPIVRRFDGPNHPERGGVISAFKIQWPGSIMIADGVIEALDGGLRVAAFNIHLGRLLSLLGASQLRRNLDLT